MSNIEAIKDNLKKATEEDIKRISKELGKYTTAQLRREIEKRTKTKLPTYYIVDIIEDHPKLYNSQSYTEGVRLMVTYLKSVDMYLVVHKGDLIKKNSIKVLYKYTGEEV